MYSLWRISSVYAILCICLSCVSSSEKFCIESLNGIWKIEEPVKFIIDVIDAEKPKNITFIIRNNKDYEYKNLVLQVSISQQDDKHKIVEKFNYTLTKPNGTWKGTGFGEIKETLGQYKTEYKFPSNDKYEIEIKHLMDINPLKGIEDIGIKIENIKL